MDWQAADLPEEFERFQQYCLLVFQGPFSDKSDKEKVAYVMLWIGRTGVDAFNSFEWDNVELNIATELSAIFSIHCIPNSSQPRALQPNHTYTSKDTSVER